jgi:hypothetical protein
VAHSCNPSHSGSRDQSQPGQIVQEILFRKHPSQKRTGEVVQGVGPEFKPQYCKKKKKKKSLPHVVAYAFRLRQENLEFKASLIYIEPISNKIIQN